MMMLRVPFLSFAQVAARGWLLEKGWGEVWAGGRGDDEEAGGDARLFPRAQRAGLVRNSV